jgi:hypothetical protein
MRRHAENSAVVGCGVQQEEGAGTKLSEGVLVCLYSTVTL